jgi:hypothetical protein
MRCAVAKSTFRRIQNELRMAKSERNELIEIVDRVGPLFVRLSCFGVAICPRRSSLSSRRPVPLGVRGGRWSRRGWWTLGVFAVAPGLDSTEWTLVCAPSSDAVVRGPRGFGRRANRAPAALALQRDRCGRRDRLVVRFRRGRSP